MDNNYLALSDIQCRAYLQQRTPNLIEDKNDFYRQCANLTSTVEKVKSDLRNGQPIEVPLEIHEVNGEYLLVDGYHRHGAATAHCRATKLDPKAFQVPVNITATSTLQAAINASFKVNLTHGVGLTPKERVHAAFRSYVWNRSVPKISEIRSATGYGQGAASNILNTVKWCVDQLNSNEVSTTTPPELKVFMTKKMTDLGIDSNKLDSYGLPTYSLLRSALKGDNHIPDEVYDEREDHIRLARQELEILESKYGVECLREGLRRHKTAAYGITIKQHKSWIKEPTTAALLATPLDTEDDF
jgi:hypothetical protein